MHLRQFPQCRQGLVDQCHKHQPTVRQVSQPMQRTCIRSSRICNTALTSSIRACSEIFVCLAVLPYNTFRLANQCSKSQAFPIFRLTSQCSKAQTSSQLRLMGQCHIHQANGRNNGKTFVFRVVPIAKLQIRLTAISAKGAAHVCFVEPLQLSQWTTTTNNLRTSGIRLKRPLKFVQMILCLTMIHGSISSVTQIGPHGWINLERYSFGQNLLRRPNNHNHSHNYNKTTLLLLLRLPRTTPLASPVC